MQAAAVQDNSETILLECGEMNAPVDVCVPLYRSARHFPKLLASLARVTVDFTLCCVVDGDGYDPRPALAEHLPDSTPIQALGLSRNSGFAHASNRAAALGSAPFILYCNADVEVTPNFLSPLLCEMGRDESVWAAGGMLLENGRIHSCGSEYSRKTRCFEHCFKGADPRINEPYVRMPGDRDMMTAACLLVRRSCVERIGGFDEAYRIGYWEDTDLCMRIRLAGGRIRYIPESVATHHANHSGAAGHKHYDANQALFHKRWVETGMVDAFALQRGVA